MRALVTAARGFAHDQIHAWISPRMNFVVTPGFPRSWREFWMIVNPSGDIPGTSL